MSDKPIIFSGPMVRALLEGRKTQTRRVLKPQPKVSGGGWVWYPRGQDLVGASGTLSTSFPEVAEPHCGYAPGDRLWVREGWAVDDDERPAYKASQLVPPYVGGPSTCLGQAGPRLARWRSPIHMPRWASRLTLTVTDVRVQRVQEISPEDAQAEGIRPPSEHRAPGECTALMERLGCDHAMTAEFANLWNDIHGLDAWDRNPWVCALTFTVHRGNIDAMGRAA